MQYLLVLLNRQSQAERRCDDDVALIPAAEGAPVLARDLDAHAEVVVCVASKDLRVVSRRLASRCGGLKQRIRAELALEARLVVVLLAAGQGKERRQPLVRSRTQRRKDKQRRPSEALVARRYERRAVRGRTRQLLVVAQNPPASPARPPVLAG